ncbi:MAG: porin, partial [Bacteroidota bacterium]|nr:porin [Bacteroidota bacterium]
DFKYYFVLETSPTKNEYPYLLDAFVTYSRFTWARASVGQFKSPFSLELNTSCSKLHTINRSKVVSELASPDRDLGVMIVGGGDTTFVKYAIGFMNGTGKGIVDDNSNKNIIGRIVFNPFEFLSFGGSFKYGTAPPADATADEEDTKTIFGGELQIKYSDFLFQSEYIYGDFAGSYTTGGGCGAPIEVHQGSVKKSGFYAQAMYMTPWNFQPVVKFESFDPDLDKDRDGAEASVDTDDEYTFKQADHGFQNTITFGVNYFFNDWTRLQINYLYQAEEIEFENDMFMIQIQAKF